MEEELGICIMQNSSILSNLQHKISLILNAVGKIAKLKQNC